MVAAYAEEITAELLSDFGTALRNILVNDYDVPAATVSANVTRGRLSLRFGSSRAPDFEAKLGKVAEALRATLIESLPSLADGLRIQLSPGLLEVFGEPPAPIYPHIIRAEARDLRITEAGRLAIAKGELKPWQ